MLQEQVSVLSPAVSSEKVVSNLPPREVIRVPTGELPLIPLRQFSNHTIVAKSEFPGHGQTLPLWRFKRKMAAGGEAVSAFGPVGLAAKCNYIGVARTASET
jgi:hypothetical protein